MWGLFGLDGLTGTGVLNEQMCVSRIWIHLKLLSEKRALLILTGTDRGSLIWIHIEKQNCLKRKAAQYWVDWRMFVAYIFDLAARLKDSINIKLTTYNKEWKT